MLRMLYGIENPFSQLGSPILAVPFPFLVHPQLTHWWDGVNALEKKKISWKRKALDTV